MAQPIIFPAVLSSAIFRKTERMMRRDARSDTMQIRNDGCTVFMLAKYADATKAKQNKRASWRLVSSST
eukprot:5976752-Prymnesium_polylepis.1